MSPRIVKMIPKTRRGIAAACGATAIAAMLSCVPQTASVPQVAAVSTSAPVPQTAVGTTSPPVIGAAQPMVTPVEGELKLREGSGLVRMDGLTSPGITILMEGNEKVPPPGGDDNAKKVPDIQIVRDAAGPFAQNTVESHREPVVLKKFKIEDIEDVAWDPERRAAFLIGSHSRNKDNEPQPDRRRLVRLLFDAQGTLLKAEETDLLEVGLRQTFPFIGPALDSANQDIGGKNGTLNIEGAAFLPDRKELLLGLRSPTDTNNKALLLRLRNPHALFDTPDTKPDFDPTPLTLDLGSQGIRGITYDPELKGCWILAGRSAHDQTNDPWTLWFWKPDTGILTQKVVPPLQIGGSQGTPEGICCLTLGGKPALLIVEDGNKKTSRYALFSKPDP